MPVLSKSEIAVAKTAVRRIIDRTGYGNFVSDAQCEQVAVEVVTDIENHRAGTALATASINAHSTSKDTS